MRSASVVGVIAVVALLLPGHVVGRAAAASARHRASDANVPLNLSVAYAYGIEPATLNAVIKVERHADNRLLRVVVDSDRLYSSSDIQLDGTESPRNHSVRWRDLPAGEYCIQATLVRTTGDLRSMRRPYWVVGPQASTSSERASPCDSLPATIAWTPVQAPLDNILVP